MHAAGGRRTALFRANAAEMPATTLASLYLGGVDPRVLARTGRLTESTPGAAGRLARLFAAPFVPWNGTRF